MSYDLNKTVVLDIQFLIGSNGEYIPKEISFKCGLLHPETYLLKPQLNWEQLSAQIRRRNRYLFYKVNGLQWNDGDIQFEEVAMSLKKMAQYTFCVVGKDKKNFLGRHIPGLNIIDLEAEYGMSFSKIQQPNNLRCGYHSIVDLNIIRCSLNNVSKIFDEMNNREMFYNCECEC